MNGKARLLSRGSGVALLLWVSVAGGGGIARAADASPAHDLEQAEQALVNLDYDSANKAAARILQQHGLTHDQLVRVYRVLALTDAVLDKEGASRDAFQQLLTYDPDYQGDPNLGPKVQGPFLEARGFMRAQPMKPGVELAVVLRPTEGGTIRVTTRDPTHVAKRAVVGFRWGGDGTFTTVPVPVAEGATADVPAPPVGTTRLDYYAQVLDDRDDVVLESGNSNVPKSATVDLAASPGPAAGATGAAPAEPEHHSIFASPIFWTITGVVLAGAGASVYFATRSKASEAPGTTGPSGPTGPGTPSGAILAPTLQCGSQRCN